MQRPASLAPSLGLAFALVALCAGRAAADPKAGARPHIERATKLYSEGKTGEALEELTIAYRIDPSPQLLYGIAQAHVVLKRCREAITYYEQFLATDPNEGPANLAREAIAHCKQAIATEPPGSQPEPSTPAEARAPASTRPLPSAPSAPSAPSPPATASAEVDTGASRPWFLDPIGDALVGGGVVAGVAGLVLYRSARSTLDRAMIAADYPTHHELVEQARRKRLFAGVSGIGGIALVSAGVAYFVLRERPGSRRVGLVPVGRGGVLAVDGRF